MQAGFGAETPDGFLVRVDLDHLVGGVIGEQHVALWQSLNIEPRAIGHTPQHAAGGPAEGEQFGAGTVIGGEDGEAIGRCQEVLLQKRDGVARTEHGRGAAPVGGIGGGNGFGGAEKGGRAGNAVEGDGAPQRLLRGQQFDKRRARLLPGGADRIGLDAERGGVGLEILHGRLQILHGAGELEARRQAVGDERGGEAGPPQLCREGPHRLGRSAAEATAVDQ